MRRKRLDDNWVRLWHRFRIGAWSGLPPIGFWRIKGMLQPMDWYLKLHYIPRKLCLLPKDSSFLSLIRKPR